MQYSPSIVKKPNLHWFSMETQRFPQYLSPSEISHIFSFLCRFHTEDSESEVIIHFNDRFDCQSLHFTSLSDEFLVQLQTTNAQKLLRMPLKLPKLTLSKCNHIYKIGGAFFHFHFLRDLQ